MYRSSQSFSKAVVLWALLSLTSGPALVQTDDGNEPDEIPFSIARMIIEFNATDEDVGVQVLLDGESYKRLNAFGPGTR